MQMQIVHCDRFIGARQNACWYLKVTQLTSGFTFFLLVLKQTVQHSLHWLIKLGEVDKGHLCLCVCACVHVVVLFLLLISLLTQPQSFSFPLPQPHHSVSAVFLPTLHYQWMHTSPGHHPACAQFTDITCNTSSTGLQHCTALKCVQHSWKRSTDETSRCSGQGCMSRIHGYKPVSTFHKELISDSREPLFFFKGQIGNLTKLLNLEFTLDRIWVGC